MTTIDILIIYTLLQLRRGRLLIVLWTTALNMLLPLAGFFMGEWLLHYFEQWSHALSGVLLALIGLHIMLDDGEKPSIANKISPFLLALLVSIDAFTVSVTFGMMQLNKWLFIFSSGFISFMFSVIALASAGRIRWADSKFVRCLTGLLFISLGIISLTL